MMMRILDRFRKPQQFPEKHLWWIFILGGCVMGLSVGYDRYQEVSQAYNIQQMLLDQGILTEGLVLQKYTTVQPGGRFRWGNPHT